VAAEAGQAEGISFLKEQQWKTPGFRTAFAESGALRRSFAATGEVLPAANRYAEISAPIGGLVDAAGLARAPLPGQAVEKGQLLATLVPALGESGSAFAASRRELREAEIDYTRSQRLLELEAVPQRRVQEAKTRLDAAREAVASLGGAGAGGRLELRSPIAGLVETRTVVPGSRVAAGARLFTVVDPSVVWLRVDVPASKAPLLGATPGAVFRLEGLPRTWTASQLVSVGSVVDPLSRTVAVILEVENPDRSIKVGASAQVSVLTAEPVQGVLLPRSAVLEEDGRPIAYVQAEGERFERRELVIGGSDAERLVAVSGLAAGERIVTGAAYQVRLASLSTAVPAHGHEH
jgi:RND family efflux transporter MFP subunit